VLISCCQVYRKSMKGNSQVSDLFIRINCTNLMESNGSLHSENFKCVYLDLRVEFVHYYKLNLHCVLFAMFYLLASSMKFLISLTCTLPEVSDSRVHTVLPSF